MTERATLTVEEAGQLLGISRGSAYAAARDGSLPTVRLGRRLVVPKCRLEQLLAGQNLPDSDAAPNGREANHLSSGPHP